MWVIAWQTCLVSSGLTPFCKYEEVRESEGVSNPGEVGLVVSLVGALLGGGAPKEDVALTAQYSA